MALFDLANNLVCDLKVNWRGAIRFDTDHRLPRKHSVKIKLLDILSAYCRHVFALFITHLFQSGLPILLKPAAKDSPIPTFICLANQRKFIHTQSFYCGTEFTLRTFFYEILRSKILGNTGSDTFRTDSNASWTLR